MGHICHYMTSYHCELTAQYVTELYANSVCYQQHVLPENYTFEFHGSTAAKCVEISTIFHDITSQNEPLYISYIQDADWMFCEFA